MATDKSKKKISNFLLSGFPRRRNVAAAVVGCVVALTTLGTPARAQGYDMDCKIILCMAGGFPSGCRDAYKEMIRRITRFPKPLPPFGICSQSDGSPYEAVKAPYSYLHRESASGWHCGEGTKLFHQVEDEDHGRSVKAFCYTHTTTRVRRDREEEWIETIYHGKTAAQPVNFQVQITVEPGTPEQFTSPLFKLNYHTGFVVQIGGDLD